MKDSTTRIADMELSDVRTPLGTMDRAGLALQEARGYAMEAFPAVRLEGPLDADLFKQAYLESLDIFPRMKQIVEFEGEGRQKRFYWREVRSDLSHTFILQDLDVADDSLESADTAFVPIQQEMLNAPGIDMTRGIGIRIYLYRTGPTRHYALIRFNHILSDGRGMMIFANFWILRYEELLKDPDSPVRAEPFRMPEEQEVRIWTMLKWVGWKSIVRFIRGMLRSLRLGRKMPVAHLADFKYGLKGRFRTWDSHLAPEKLLELRSRAKAMGMTMNDLALAAGYHTVLRFCSREGIEVKRMKINSPKDIREEDSTQVFNLAVPRVISLIPAEIRDDHHLIETIREELRRIMDSKIYFLGALGVNLLGKLSFDRLVRIIRRQMERGHNPAATILISNVGEITSFGSFNALGEAVTAHLYHGARGQYPPGYITPLFSFKGTMTLGFGYYEPAMTEEKCARLGSIFFEELERISKLDLGDQ
ncbi:hypothetical protein ACFL4G_03435 [Thermodesulfobacteriota bacterium]